MLAVLFHELGHVAVMIVNGQRIESVCLTAGGLDIRRSGKSGYLADAAVALGGPLFGLVSAFAALYLGWDAYFTVSLAYSLFNLLPVCPFDGGAFLRALLLYFLEYSRAEGITRAVGSLTLIAFYFCAVLLLLYTEWNASLLAVFLCIFVSTFLKENV